MLRRRRFAVLAVALAGVLLGLPLLIAAEDTGDGEYSANIRGSREVTRPHRTPRRPLSHRAAEETVPSNPPEETEPPPHRPLSGWGGGAVLSALQLISVVVYLSVRASRRERGGAESPRGAVEPETQPTFQAQKIDTACGRDAADVRQRGHHRTEEVIDIPPDSDGDDSKNKERRQCGKAGPASYLLALAVVMFTYFAAPTDWKPKRPTTHHVFYYGWLTDIATAVGALPFVCVRSLGDRTVGLSNAVAAGMMQSASAQLFIEGVENKDGVLTDGTGGGLRVLAGCACGVLFILTAERVLSQHEELKVGDLTGLSARKVLLIITVMTLHSFAEGVGVGVSFGGPRGSSLGFCISICLAIHNIPEGLAVALVLVTRGVGTLNVALWCVFTSLPQPLMAVPAFAAVGWFLPLLPLGLGFAGGAMLWVAYAELLAEAADAVGMPATAVASSLSFACAYAVQQLVVD